MYLVNILRLSQGDRPVSLGVLAESLGVSPISANQMCRRLQDDGLVTYIPYKGVSTTPEGAMAARRILRRHRLWEVFLVQHLKLRWEDAHETACRLEHATPDEVIERLDDFLQHPRVNPQGEFIPSREGDLQPRVSHTLADMSVGQRAHCVLCSADQTTCDFLASVGLFPGVQVRLLVEASGSLLLEVGAQKAVIDRMAAKAVWVEIDNE